MQGVDKDRQTPVKWEYRVHDCNYYARKDVIKEGYNDGYEGRKVAVHFMVSWH